MSYEWLREKSREYIWRYTCKRLLVQISVQIQYNKRKKLQITNFLMAIRRLARAGWSQVPCKCLYDLPSLTIVSGAACVWGVGVVGCLRQCRTVKAIKSATIWITAAPPTTPPAIAPTFNFLFVTAVGVGVAKIGFVEFFAWGKGMIRGNHLRPRSMSTDP